MKYLLTVLLTLMALPALAQDSGVLYDPERNGEGLIWTRHLDYVVAFIFTYGREECADIFGPGGWWDSCTYDGTRWFMISGDRLSADGNSMSGFLYEMEGINYPDGEPVPGKPFQRDVAEPVPVGVYEAARSGDGWKILVLPFGAKLSPYDELYSRVWNFTSNLFPATH